MPAMMGVGEIPQAPGAVPVLGHVGPFLRDPLGFVDSLSAHGELVQFRLGSQFMVMVCDPALTHEVLVDDRTYDKGGPFYERVREGAGDGLASCPNSKHRRQRRLCQPAFHPDRLPTYSAPLAASAVTLADSWRPAQVIDVYDEMFGLFVRDMVEALFGTAVSAVAATHFAADIGIVLDGLFRRMISPPLLNKLPTRSNRRYQRALVGMRRTAEETIAARRAEPGDNGDLLSALLTASDSESSGVESSFDDTELVDQVTTFMVGAGETTASTVAWALSLLAAHPEVERQAQAEVDRVLDGAIPMPHHVDDLKLIGRVVTETLRLYPIVWMLSRTVTRDVDLGGFRLSAGTALAVSPYLIHRRGDLYPEPDRFDPDRWRDSQPNRTIFLPFGAGARKCIGNRLALSQATLVLAAILSRRQLVPATTQGARPGKFLLTPRGLRMRVQERRRQSR
jgi:cytochrome P450